jgi:hypothetical protein
MAQPTENVNPKGSKNFLTLFPENRRSWVMQRFLAVVREGERDQTTVVSRVLAESHAKALSPCSDEERTKHMGLGLAIEDHLLDALALAQHCLWWESLPPEARSRQKSVSAEQHRAEWMRRQPATQRQIMFLHQLGYRGPVADRQAASSEISKRLAGGRS